VKRVDPPKKTTRLFYLIFLSSSLLIFILSPSQAGVYSGGSGTPEDPYQIATTQDLVVLSQALGMYDKSFVLSADIDLGGRVFDRAVIGYFRGRFDGNGFVISNMTIDGSDAFGGSPRSPNLGLFGHLGEGAEIHDLGVVNVHIANYFDDGTTGGIAARNDEGRIFNCFSTGKLYGRQSVGGIVGENNGGSVSDCSSAMTVSGLRFIGGIVGDNRGNVSNCYSTGMVRGHRVGGIAGTNAGSVTYCYSTSVVFALSPAGAGGLVGGVREDFYINYGISSFWDIETSGLTTSNGGVGLTTDLMQDRITYLEEGWGINYHPDNSPDNLWWMPEGDTPRLWWQYGHAYAPSPGTNASTAIRDLALQWRPGGPGLQHDVYFSDEEAIVADANTQSQGVYLGRQPADTLSYHLNTLEQGRTYYWRIDGVSDTDPGRVWKGSIWSFTITDFVIVNVLDDFESYDYGCNRIFFTWQDGWSHSRGENVGGCEVAPYDGNNGTGAMAGHLAPPYESHFIVHGGSQSMPVSYDNTSWPWYSEAERTWSTAQDWTSRDADALTLYFRGDAENSQDPNSQDPLEDPLYVVIQDSHGPFAVVYHPNASAVLTTEWQVWHIALADLDADVDLTAITTLVIGVGKWEDLGPAGTGTIFIDDIQLTKRVP